MTKSDALAALLAWRDDPDGIYTCDGLCDAAEYLGLPAGEYDDEWLEAEIRRTP